MITETCSLISYWRPFVYMGFRTLEVLMPLMFTRMLPTGRIIPLHTQPLPFCAFYCAVKANSTELTVERESLSNIDICRHDTNASSFDAKELNFGRRVLLDYTFEP
jgi:hypothetical protein